MTKRELMALLQSCPEEWPVRALWDGLLWPVRDVVQHVSHGCVVLDVRSDTTRALPEAIAAARTIDDEE